MITSHQPNIIAFKGRSLGTLLRFPVSFSEWLQLSLRGGHEPNDDLLINALLMAWVDHGVCPPSTQAARQVAACGGSLFNAVAAALLTMGETHVPIDGIAELLQKRAEDPNYPLPARVPGFGHPVHDIDPRVLPLSELHTSQKDRPHYDALRKIESDLKGRARPNLAGITAALLLDLGFPRDVLGLFPVLGRSVGLALHFKEQREKFPPLQVPGESFRPTDS